MDAAVQAGAEVREGFTVERLLWDDERVVGTRGHSRAGQAIEERARIVIGADGIHSLIAKAVKAREYDTRPALTTNYYTYYSGFDADDIEMYVRDFHAIGCFPTHDGLTLIAVLWPCDRFPEIRADVERHFMKALELAPTVARGVERARREEKWSGIAGLPNYFRQPFGPGWALVGDAGYHKDPITAQGISDAFIDADAVATALAEGWSGTRDPGEALAAAQTKRDARVKAMYEFTLQLATLEPPPPFMQRLFAALHGKQVATNQFFSAITGSRPLPEFMSPENLDPIMANAEVEAAD